VDRALYFSVFLGESFYLIVVITKYMMIAKIRKEVNGTFYRVV